jgi:hypothetical protein
MAPFFKREIIDRFLREFTKYTGLEILTNEDDHARLQPILPIIMENASEICRGSIGDTYLENTIMDNAFGVDTIFDTAILLEHGDQVPIGFIVVEKGECKRRGYENVWSVNLICAKDKTKGNKSGLGAILLGLYLYTIANNDLIEPKKAILELANGYLNVGGLASYMKLGFIVDETLYGTNCFRDYGNLPMVVNDIQPKRVIDILNGQDLGYEKLPICNIRGNLQLYLGLCKNLYTFINKNKQDEYVIPEYELADKRIINFELLNKHITDSYMREKGITKMKKKEFKAWFLGYITNIETHYSSIDPNSLFGFSILHSGIITKAPEIKEKEILKKEIVVDIERRLLRSNLRIDVVPTQPVSRQRSNGGRSNSGRSKRNKKSNRRKTKKT